MDTSADGLDTRVQKTKKSTVRKSDLGSCVPEELMDALCIENCIPVKLC